MLISMPTGTSTIFGVFQAILALLVNRTNSALSIKLMRKEKFASEIFCLYRAVLCCTAKGNSPDCAARRQTNAGSTGSDYRPSTAMPMQGRTGAASLDKELVRCRQNPSSAPQRTGFRPMPRYYFNTRIDDELIADPEGEELPNPDRAWEIARAMIRELLKTEGAEVGLLNAVLEVTDDEGEVVLEFPFTEAILDFPGNAVTKH
jgi:hypothetical protein